MKLLAEKSTKEFPYIGINRHPLVCVRIKGRDVLCDQDVANLVVLMNSIFGIETEWSCQGDESHTAYLIFKGLRCAELYRFLFNSLDKLIPHTIDDKVAYLKWAADPDRYLYTRIHHELYSFRSSWPYLRILFYFNHRDMRMVESLVRQFRAGYILTNG